MVAEVIDLSRQAHTRDRALVAQEGASGALRRKAQGR